MPTLKGEKTRKHTKSRDSSLKTRHHSNLRPKTKTSRDFLKVYYPYLPMLMIVLVILALIQPWFLKGTNASNVLSYATSISSRALTNVTNERRAVKQTPDLALSESLSNAAQAKANDMVQKDYWSHNTPTGDAPWVFINDASYSYKKAGENLAYGFANVEDVIAGWMNSPAHRENMLDPSYQDVGFGFAESKNFTGDGPTTVVVAMYGQPLASDVLSESNNVSFSTQSSATEPPTQSISKAQTFTNGVSPWLPYAIGALIGGLTIYLLIKHGRRIKRVITHGERFVIRHPVLDVTIVTIIILCVVVSQQSGVIR